jgi:exopolysaccharide biosynthesis polyprenyl glycosylphosphotransferase
MITNWQRNPVTINLHAILQHRTKIFKYIIIGGNSTNIDAIDEMFYQTYGEKAVCVGRFGNTLIHSVKTLGTDGEIIHFLQRYSNIQRVVYINSELTPQEKQELARLCALKYIDLVFISPEPDLWQEKKHIEQDAASPVLIRKKRRITRISSRVMKRTFDIFFSLLVIIFVLSWMIPLFAILIKLESKGPVFFVQPRTGYFNSCFSCLKFRSMEVNAECNEKQATKSDPRLTRFGAFIRRYNLDEFPQFINVFLGHMSVVGPRPHMLKHTSYYAKLINGFMLRHSVKPGITGWAQVNGYRGPTKTVKHMRNRVEHDIWYIENWSFLLDMKCILMTVINFLKGEENAF